MTFSAWAHSHTRSILFLLAALVLAGAIASFSLPVALFPQVSFPRVRVTLDAGDRPAERMTVEVTTPVEEAVRAIPGVREHKIDHRAAAARRSRSISIGARTWSRPCCKAQSRGEQDPAEPAAGHVVRSRAYGPDGFSGDRLQSHFRFSFVSRAARSRAVSTLRPALSTVQGVARVGVQGGRDRGIPGQCRSGQTAVVQYDPGRSRQRALGIERPGRSRSARADHDKLYLVVSDTRFKKFEEIEHTVLRSNPDGVVLLEDVADR